MKNQQNNCKDSMKNDSMNQTKNMHENQQTQNCNGHREDKNCKDTEKHDRG